MIESSQIQYCPEVFADETLYSWLSRWVYSTPSPSINLILERMLGSHSKQLDSLFPSYVVALAQQASISEAILINAHTLVPYFRHFCNESLYCSTLKDMHSGETQSTHSKMSLIAGRIKESRYLNFCPGCVEDDINQWGIAYWHVAHQLPGLSSCVTHGLNLKGVKKYRRGLLRPPQTVVKEDLICASPRALKLAQLSIELLSFEPPLFEGEVMAMIYRHRLLEMGLASERLNIHQAELRVSLKEYWGLVLQEETIAHIFELGGGHTYPTCLFYQASAHHHPLKHLLMIGMIFESIGELVHFHKSIISNQAMSNKVHRNKIDKQVKMELALAALKAGSSLRQSCNASGLSIGKVKQIAVSHNVSIQRREQKLFAMERELILQDLKRLKSTQEIAILMNCSVGAVEQILSQHPTVVEHRRKERFMRKCHFHRANLIVAMRKQPHCTRSSLQQAVRTDYTWLFRYDKAWLYRVLPAKQPAKYWGRK
ncbi:TnsD family Tn7-like transposition protein [Shewanella sp. 4_MG-2023]|uniref:TnsD family Tn7-like transposition protein n=1 Tax=Shewanella sp. 4_MG-2023 TaxID=3062652 RepID=UPI0026E30F08|nr:TnsD family Tn7-like transposition protein [Shewanella sp. 4_MG-2023]MDO6677097.1 TnsD family Tn7-like transposition protein [Shewanella sp. 4_MG-2023]